jgi:type III secretion protein L
MKFFSLIKDRDIHIAPDTKIIPAEKFGALIDSKELLDKTKNEAINYREEVAKECEQLKGQSELAGFEEGLSRLNQHLAHLEQERNQVRREMENAIVPLALAAVKKIIGREIELKPETIVDIVSTALKSVSQHKRVAIYVNKGDLELLEQNRGRLKDLFENLQSLSIIPREDIARGECVIETEVGIINARLDSQLKALEEAFHSFFHNHSKKEQA